MNHYQYICTICHKDFSISEIENHLHYLCPACGYTKENQPLHGILTILYDYDELRKKMNRQKFLKYPPGDHYLYPELWPIDHSGPGEIPGISQAVLNRLKLPSNSVYPVKIGNIKFIVLDETHNPTFSYKDRASVLVAIKAIQKGITEISVASTGNAGSSLAGICAQVGLNAHIWVPEMIPQEKLSQILAYGADVHMVAGSYDDAFDLSTNVCHKNGWFNRNTAYNPLTIEGKKSAAFDIFIGTRGNIPDVIFIPVGDGVIIAGLFKGFTELAQLGWIDRFPQLIGVQADGCNPVSRYLQSDLFELRAANTIADSICAAVPRNLYMAARAIRESKGTCLTVSDRAMLDAQRSIIRETGVLLEPSAAAAFAGYEKSLNEEIISADKSALIIATGNGLKDMQSLNRGLTFPRAHTISHWKEYYEIE